MGEILGIGLTHYPPLVHLDQNMSGPLKFILRSPGLPEQYRQPENWPAPMRAEWGTDEGTSTACRHREALVIWFRKARRVLDDFAPDFIVIWGDDQYENFKEDVIPAFCVMAYETIPARAPWTESFGRMLGPNVWDEPDEKTFTLPGHRAGAKYLASGLLAKGFDKCFAFFQP